MGKSEIEIDDEEYSWDDYQYPQNESNEVGSNFDEYPAETHYFDEGPEGNHEQLFDGEEKNFYKMFCRDMIMCPLPTPALEDPSSPFTGKDDEVDGKFANFVAEFPGEEDQVAYLRLRKGENEITVSLSKEDLGELDDPLPYWGTAQLIDSYLHCRLSLFPNEIQQRVNRCSAYMISLNLKNLNQWNDRTPLTIFEKALDSELKEVDFNIIPLLYEDHWTLAIVCGLGQEPDAHLPSVPFTLPCVLHFNSLKPKGIKYCHAYTIAKLVAKKSQIDANDIEWHEIWSPQQLNHMDCAFYVMRFVVDFVKNISLPHYLPVQDLFYILQSSQRYVDEDRSAIKKVAKKARQQLKGFIGSIKRKERDWIYEFDEGRPCTIDTLQYCIPEKILEVDGNECKVKMLNYMKETYVPLDYVKEHWKHIYNDYIMSERKYD